jgi:hypothetical protein
MIYHATTLRILYVSVVYQLDREWCTFIGYSIHHKGYKCLDVSTSQVYISRDVVFDESVFPFAALHSNAGARLWATISLLPSSLVDSTMIGGSTVDHTNVLMRTNPIAQLCPVHEVLHATDLDDRYVLSPGDSYFLLVTAAGLAMDPVVIPNLAPSPLDVDLLPATTPQSAPNPAPTDVLVSTPALTTLLVRTYCRESFTRIFCVRRHLCSATLTSHPTCFEHRG